jgi:hypothetical protein
MTNHDRPGAPGQPTLADGDIDLFDEDVEASGEQAPDGDQLTDTEFAAIRASQADPSTPPADAEAN